MGNTNRRRGFGFEREVVNLLKSHGFEARRMWGSDGRSAGLPKEVDLVWSFPEGQDLHMQLKRKKKLPQYLRQRDVDATVFREDRGDTLVLLPLESLIALLKDG